MIRSWMLAVSFAAMLGTPIPGARQVHAEAIVVSHDINTLGSVVTQRTAGTQEETFAVNVAQFLTSAASDTKVLLLESNPGDGDRDFSAAVVAALTNAGFSVTETSDYDNLPERLGDYDA